MITTYLQSTHVHEFESLYEHDLQSTHFHGFPWILHIFLYGKNGFGTVDQSRPTVPHEDGEPTQLVFRCLQHVLFAKRSSKAKGKVGKVWEIPWQTSNPSTVWETSMIFTKTDVSDIVHVSCHFLRQQGSRNFAPVHQPLRSALFDPWN